MKAFNFTPGGAYRPLSEINVIPLVDVMMVLLIIFMVTTPMIQGGVEVRLPQAASAAPAIQEGLVVTIDRDRSVYLERRKMTLDEFEAVFAAVYSPTSNRPVFIKADVDVPYGAVIAVLDKIKTHGVTNLGLVTEPIPRRR
ncbi:MAG: biopolymer transporter ExbD [Candidatus Latescibacteria bacterium]|nr:biopolymer transporter ExbD [Candidatus Latescibacterota bacterium]